jgi:Ser/Thr protein kinase RdoA (MazF antagonist)
LTLVHGHQGEAVAAPWPALTVAELAPVLAQYPGLGEPQSITWHSPRPFAASGLVATERATVFVKRHDPRVRKVADLAEEHAFIAHLRQAGVPVPNVLRTREGATAIAARSGTYEVHARLPHADPYRDAVSWSPFASLAHASSAGRALAKLHGAACGFANPKRRTGLLVADFTAFGSADPMAALERRVAAEPMLAAALAGRPWRQDFRRVLLPLHAALAPLLPALQPLWTHNDWHASNLLWSGDGGDAQVAAIMDFGLANRTNAMFDLATAIERNAVQWLLLAEGRTDIAQADAAQALVEGYCEIRPLSAEEAAALPYMLPVVHVEFALSELAYFQGVLKNATSADAAYQDFLLSHAQWFETAAGANLQKSFGSFLQKRTAY